LRRLAEHRVSLRDRDLGSSAIRSTARRQLLSEASVLSDLRDAARITIATAQPFDECRWRRPRAHRPPPAGVVAAPAQI